MFRSVFLASALALTLSAAAMAAGSDDSVSDETPQDRSLYDQAVALIDNEEFTAAEKLLQAVVADDPGDADAWNYLGFAQRQQDKDQAALESYGKALAIDPGHLGANEYLGELYLKLKRLDDAEGRLEVLQEACGACEEYRDLAEQIAAYKAANPS